MEKIWDMINYLVGVCIYDRNDVLVIEDRRPNRNMFLAVLGLLTIIGFVIAYLLNILMDFSIGLKFDALSWAFVLVALAAASYFVISGTFREVYIFDRQNDTYIFTRQSLRHKDVLEGSLSQFRAVQVERRTDDDSETYMVALLMQGLLLGQSDTQFLREKRPLFNSRAAESRIAAAISKFLNIERQGLVDIL